MLPNVKISTRNSTQKIAFILKYNRNYSQMVLNIMLPVWSSLVRMFYPCGSVQLRPASEEIEVKETFVTKCLTVNHRFKK